MFALCGGCDGENAQQHSEHASWLEQARQAHLEADRAHDGETRQHAINRLLWALDRVPGPADANAWVRQDLMGRLAQLHLKAGQFERALEWCERALSLGSEPSVPVANLLVVSAKAYEAQGNEAMAVQRYHEALIMNQTLMERSLEGDP